MTADYMINTEDGFPRRINWFVVAGKQPHPIQMYDLVYDKQDLKSRKLL